ncbi:MAG: hypothetical protein R3A50_18050 [Saprospiraceae bacterium]
MGPEDARYFFVPEADFNDGHKVKIELVVPVNLWEHDTSSAHDKFVYRGTSVGSQFYTRANENNMVGNNFSAARIEAGGTMVIFEWAVEPY